MEELFEQQLAFQTKLANAYENYKKLKSADKSRGKAGSYLDHVNKVYERFQKNHDSILALDNLDKKHQYFQLNINEIVEDLYYDRKGDFNEVLYQFDKAEALEAAANPHSQQASTRPQPTVQVHSQMSVDALLRSLTDVKIPKFSGKYKDWANFRDLFRSLVHRRDDLANVLKMNILKSRLEGDALNQLNGLPVTDENYTKSWQVLLDYYDNKRRLINSYLSSWFSAKPMGAKETSQELSRLFRETFTPLDHLKAIGRPVDEWNDVIVFMTVSRFHQDTRSDWHKQLGSAADPSTVNQLKEFIQTRILTLEANEGSSYNIFKGESTQQSSSQRKAGKSNVQSSEQAAYTLQVTEKGTKKSSNGCALCSKDHFISYCEVFKAKTVPERKNIVVEKNLCFNCLGPHQIKQCRSSKTCFTCRKKHHTLLHMVSANPSSKTDTISQVNLTLASSSKSHDDGQSDLSSNHSDSQQAQTQSTSRAAHSTKVTSIGKGVLLATAKIIIIGTNGLEATVRALIDPCSQASFVSESLCQRLRLKRRKANVNITGVGDQSTTVCKGVTHFTVTPHFESTFSCDVEALVLPRVSAYTPPLIDYNVEMIHLQGLKLADPEYMKPHTIDVLLGASVYASIIEGKVVKGGRNEPIATLSLLGWLLSGDTPSLQQSLSPSISSFHCAEERLDEVLSSFWEQEEVPSVVRYTKEEQECEDFFLSTHYRKDDGSYVVRLPFRNPLDLKQIKSMDTYTPSVRSLQRMEAKFERDPKLKEAYVQFMQEYKHLGHMVLASEAEVQKEPSESIFLPHHGVWKESSSTTRLRTVFNGSFKSSSGTSLNQLLHVGPNLLPNLADLFYQWRMYEIVFTSDIEKMYRNVWLDERDRHLQSVIWRDNPDLQIETYRLATVTYGLAPSAYLASRVVKQLAIDGKIEYPLGAEILQSQVYMDDVMSGEYSVQGALAKQKQVINLAKSGGFNLRKWSSNNIKLLEWLPDDMLASDTVSFFNNDSSVAVLGVSWQPQADEFRFQIDTTPIEGTVSKRLLLSRIARLFDPLGWLAPVIVIPKLLMQELWLHKINWDTAIPADILKRWLSWHAQLSVLSDLKIPRWSRYSPKADIIELHGFADASIKAYAAVIYLRVIDGDNVTVTLQAAKTKVAPIKPVSVPRLELCAARLLARLVNHFLASVSITISSSHLWSDSSDVLFWLKACPSRWKPYVANRCAEIHSLVPNSFWHHVRTNKNPADVASRGIDPSKFLDCKLWWQGPDFCSDNTNPWVSSHDDLTEFIQNPQSAESIAANAETITCCVEEEKSVWDLIDRYSSYKKLLRITAYVLRFIVKLKNRKLKFKFSISSLKFINFSKYDEIDKALLKNQEVENARLLWVYWIQSSYFSNEIKDLRSNRNLKAKSSLIKLKPVLKDDLLRVGGRLTHSPLSLDRKHPLILPGNHRFVLLLIRHFHTLSLHGGTQLTLCTIRQQYWLVCGRQAVKSAIQKCFFCVKYAAPYSHQLMGDLPTARVSPFPPFQHSGVDYAGPIKLRLTKSRGNTTIKGYIVIFVCMCTRAVHIEVAEDLSAEAFIAAFERFVSRRGQCTDLYSDQGTNFVGADAELASLFNEASTTWSQIAFSLSNDGTQWHFNPPGAPHFGGLWEAAVKSTKHHLRRVMGENVFTLPELTTLLCRIEACLNSRPITALTDDPSDLQPLTPALILLQRSSYLVPEPNRQRDKIPIGKRWQLVTQMLQSFWSRWYTEYLSSLQQRYKWQYPNRSVQVGDLVLIRNELTPPGKWPLARVINVHPGQDGLVRAVTVRTATSTFQRPITKLVLLPIE